MTQLTKIEIKIEAPSEEIGKKMIPWAKVGEQIHNVNLSLQVKAEAIKLKLAKIPKTLAEVNAAEDILAEAKKEAEALIEDRKVVTARFKKVADALMQWEKSLPELLKAYSDGILALKQAEGKRISDEQDKIKKRANMKELCINAINIGYDQYYKEMSEKINTAYEHALTKKITVAKIGPYVAKLKAFFDETTFEMKPKAGASEDSVAVWNEAMTICNKPDSKAMYAEYCKKCEEKFEFYSTALLNAEGALAAQKLQAEKEAEERAQALLNSQANARLETQGEITSKTAVISTTVSETKKKYVLDIEDGEISAIIIITAFMQNFNKAKKGVRVKEWFNLSVGQMGNALAWMKNEDERVEFTGITFKVEEKI